MCTCVSGAQEFSSIPYSGKQGDWESQCVEPVYFQFEPNRRDVPTKVLLDRLLSLLCLLSLRVSHCAVYLFLCLSFPTCLSALPSPTRSVSISPRSLSLSLPLPLLPPLPPSPPPSPGFSPSPSSSSSSSPSPSPSPSTSLPLHVCICLALLPAIKDVSVCVRAHACVHTHTHKNAKPLASS